MGKIIVIDGLDGSGKATQTELARQELEKLLQLSHKLIPHNLSLWNRNYLKTHSLLQIYLLFSYKPPISVPTN